MAAFYEDEMEEDQQTFDERENNYMNESRSIISRMITPNQNHVTTYIFIAPKNAKLHLFRSPVTK